MTTGSRMKGIPTLSDLGELEQRVAYDPERDYSFSYRSRHHRELPHVVKFSGGRSSGMLLFALLENGFLRQERGDVVVFNNTSCEHPETYKFASECKRRVESDYGVPFLFIQFQTYEDAVQGEWRRLPSYRLVNDRPFSEANPDGFHWKGEVFEEMISHKAYLPNQFRRVCTASLKLEVTRQFLRDWLASKESIARQGHGVEESLVDFDILHNRHLRSGGGVPKSVLQKKKEYVLSQPTIRPKQRYSDFSAPASPFDNEAIKDKVFGRKAWFGDGGIEYVAFIGLRGDERLRTARVEARATDPHANAGYEGEHVYMPLATMNVSKDDVIHFWSLQDWDLNLDTTGALSNCVYCFLKGVGTLSAVHSEMEQAKDESIDNFGPTAGTPCDVDWWIGIEQKYSRNLDDEGRERTNPETSVIGFFGASSEFSYDLLSKAGRNGDDLATFSDTLLPCDCTE